MRLFLKHDIFVGGFLSWNCNKIHFLLYDIVAYAITEHSTWLGL